MDAIVFGDGTEPYSIARGGVKRWLHCRILYGEKLSEARQVELAMWMQERDLGYDGCLLVTRDESGAHKLHVGSGAVEINLTDLPTWLQRPEPEAPTPPSTVRAKRK